MLLPFSVKVAVLSSVVVLSVAPWLLRESRMVWESAWVSFSLNKTGDGIAAGHQGGCALVRVGAAVHGSLIGVQIVDGFVVGFFSGNGVIGGKIIAGLGGGVGRQQWKRTASSFPGCNALLAMASTSPALPGHRAMKRTAPIPLSDSSFFLAHVVGDQVLYYPFQPCLLDARNYPLPQR